MTDAEYLLTQRAIISAALGVLNVDLTGFLERIRHAEAVGPVMDPTLYRKAHRNLEAVKELAESLQNFKRAAVRLRDVYAGELEETGGEES